MFTVKSIIHTLVLSLALTAITLAMPAGDGRDIFAAMAIAALLLYNVELIVVVWLAIKHGKTQHIVSSWWCPTCKVEIHKIQDVEVVDTLETPKHAHGLDFNGYQTVKSFIRNRYWFRVKQFFGGVQ